MTCRDLIFQKSVQILQSHLASLGTSSIIPPPSSILAPPSLSPFRAARTLLAPTAAAEGLRALFDLPDPGQHVGRGIPNAAGVLLEAEATGGEDGADKQREG